TSAVLHTYKVEGVGEDFWPGTFDRTLVDEWVQVSDRDSLLTGRDVTRDEGILIGGSGGMAVWGALKIAREADDPSGLVVVLLPDSGRGYLSKMYNDDWMRENGFLSRFRGPKRIGELVTHHGRQVPDVVWVSTEDTVARAIEVLRAHDISQLPVVRPPVDGAIEIHSIVGSIQERTLLDRLYENPEVLQTKVTSIMDGAFNLVDASEEIERVFPLFGSGASAVLVQREGTLIGVITRADLLEYAVHQPKSA
ncbi:MAG: CBS domain-containing protein, partial [Thermomicrobiales bacterium]